MPIGGKDPLLLLANSKQNFWSGLRPAFARISLLNDDNVWLHTALSNISHLSFGFMLAKGDINEGKAVPQVFSCGP